MSIEDELKNIDQLYKIYLEKKKILYDNLYSDGSHFNCNHCPLLNICIKEGKIERTGDEDEY